MPPATEAAILCGGRGERLKPLSDYFQKVMIPIGPKKLPLLAYVLELVTHYGITRVALLTGYRSDDIRHYFGDGSQHGLKLRYSEDRAGTSGSLNAVANALRNGAISRDCKQLLIYYGDVLTDLNIKELVATHRRKAADATIVLAKGYMLPVGTAEVGSDGLVKAFREKPELPLNVTTGCMLVGPRAIALMKKKAGATNTDLMTHFLPGLLRSGGRVASFFTQKQWYDVGTVSSFERLNQELVRHPFSYFE